MSFDEATSGEIENMRAIGAGVKRPIERVERFNVTETGVLYASRNKPIAASLQFVMHEHTEEVKWPEVVCACLLSANSEYIRHAAQSQLA